MDIYVFVVRMRWIAVQRDVLDLFTLTFDSSPIKGEGILSVGLSCCCRDLHLWIADQVRNGGEVGLSCNPPQSVTIFRPKA